MGFSIWDCIQFYKSFIGQAPGLFLKADFWRVVVLLKSFFEKKKTLSLFWKLGAHSSHSKDQNVTELIVGHAANVTNFIFLRRWCCDKISYIVCPQNAFSGLSNIFELGRSQHTWIVFCCYIYSVDSSAYSQILDKPEKTWQRQMV